MTVDYTNRACVPELLESFFDKHPRVALAFSGGTDSAYLLYAAKACGCDVRPFYAKSPFQPEFELKDAEKLCLQLNVEMTVVNIDVLSVPEIAINPSNRCYFCKQALFSALTSRAKQEGYDVMIDGTNASDDASDRPGMKALREIGVLSPLRACGITKREVREYSEKAGLFTWNKPAYACLATRVPTGTEITGELLRRVESAEEALFELGFTDFRVRVFEGAARLQLPGEQMMRAVSMRSEIREAIESYFPVVMMDLRER